MTDQEFIDYIVPFGTNVQHLYGKDRIEKTIDLTYSNSYLNSFNCRTSNGEGHYLVFKINDEISTIKECVNLINSHERDKKISNILMDAKL